MRRRRVPRSIAGAMDDLLARSEPLTPLSRVQRAWPEAVGEALAAHCTPMALDAGTLVVGCDAAVWASELDLLQAMVLERLAAAVGEGTVIAVRARTGPTRGWGARER